MSEAQILLYKISQKWFIMQEKTWN